MKLVAAPGKSRELRRGGLHVLGFVEASSVERQCLIGADDETLRVPCADRQRLGAGEVRRDFGRTGMARDQRRFDTSLVDIGGNSLDRQAGRGQHAPPRAAFRGEHQRTGLAP